MQIFFISLIIFLLGLSILVYGYRIFMVMLPVWGFFAGFWLGADATSLILGTGFLGSVTGWVVGFVLGLVLAILSYLFYGIAVVIQAAIIGFSIGNGLIAAFLGHGTISALFGALFAVIVIILVIAFNLQKYVVITITSLFGSNTILSALLLVLGRITLQSLKENGTTFIPIVEDSWLWLLAWVMVAGAGIASQLRVNRRYEFQSKTYLEGWG